LDKHFDIWQIIVEISTKILPKKSIVEINLLHKGELNSGFVENGQK